MVFDSASTLDLDWLPPEEEEAESTILNRVCFNAGCEAMNSLYFGYLVEVRPSR